MLLEGLLAFGTNVYLTPSYKKMGIKYHCGLCLFLTIKNYYVLSD